MPTPSAARVTGYTDLGVNARLRRQLEMNIAYFAQHPDQIDRRLEELDREWDIQRTLETGASALTLAGLLMSITAGRKWLLLPLAVQGFFLQHALQGGCPPLPLFRNLGVRTAAEIDQERYALKVLRGDFNTVPQDPQDRDRADYAFRAVAR